MEPPSLEFLTELKARARDYGWSGDYFEVSEFVEALYKEAGIDPGDMEPTNNTGEDED